MSNTVINPIDLMFNPSLNTSFATKPHAVSNIYSIDFKNGKDGVYQSIVRFVPFWKDPNRSRVRRDMIWAVNPVTNVGMYINYKNESGNDRLPLVDLYFNFLRSPNVKIQEFAKRYFKPKTQYASLIQVIRDNYRADLNNRIMVFKYGRKLCDKLWPAAGDDLYASYTTTQVSPLELCDPAGTLVLLSCKGQGGFNNFEDSKFVSGTGNLSAALRFKNIQGYDTNNPEHMAAINAMEYQIATPTSDREVIFDYLKRMSPDLDEFDYKPLTSEQQAHMDEIIKIATEYYRSAGNDDVLSRYMLYGDSANGNKPSTPNMNSLNEINNLNSANSSLNFGATIPQTPVPPVPPVPPVNTGISGIDIPTNSGPIMQDSVDNFFGNSSVQNQPNPGQVSSGMGDIDDIISML